MLKKQFLKINQEVFPGLMVIIKQDKMKEKRQQKSKDAQIDEVIFIPDRLQGLLIKGCPGQDDQNKKYRKSNCGRG